MKTFRARRLRITVAATTAFALAAIVAISSAPPAFADSSFPTLAGSNIRSQPTTASTIVGSRAKGALVTIDCYLNGESIGGTTIWDHVVGSGYISDALVKTGSDGPVVPLCGSGQPSNTFPTLAAVNVRTAASSGAALITTLAKGTQVAIDCYVDGESVSGTTIWDHRVDGGYLTDSLLLTGSNGPVVPKCVNA